MRARLGSAMFGIILSLLVVSAYEWVYEATATPTLNLITQDLKRAVLQYKTKKYSVKTWLNKALAARPSNFSMVKIVRLQN